MIANKFLKTFNLDSESFYDRVILDLSDNPKYFVFKSIPATLSSKKVKILKIIPKENNRIYCQGLK